MKARLVNQVPIKAAAVNLETLRKVRVAPAAPGALVGVPVAPGGGNGKQ